MNYRQVPCLARHMAVIFFMKNGVDLQKRAPQTSDLGCCRLTGVCGARKIGQLAGRVLGHKNDTSGHQDMRPRPSGASGGPWIRVGAAQKPPKAFWSSLGKSIPPVICGEIGRTTRRPLPMQNDALLRATGWHSSCCLKSSLLGTS